MSVNKEQCPFVFQNVTESPYPEMELHLPEPVDLFGLYSVSLNCTRSWDASFNIELL